MSTSINIVVSSHDRTEPGHLWEMFLFEGTLFSLISGETKELVWASPVLTHAQVQSSHQESNAEGMYELWGVNQGWALGPWLKHLNMHIFASPFFRPVGLLKPTLPSFGWETPHHFLAKRRIKIIRVQLSGINITSGNERIPPRILFAAGHSLG